MFPALFPEPVTAIIITYCRMPLGKVKTDVLELWIYPIRCHLCGREEGVRAFEVNGLDACARCMLWFTKDLYIQGLKDYHIDAGLLYIGVDIQTRRMRRALNPRRRRRHREAMMCPVAKTLCGLRVRPEPFVNSLIKFREISLKTEWARRVENSEYESDGSACENDESASESDGFVYEYWPDF